MELKKCCVCVDLKIGSLIIGYLHLVSGLCVFLFYATSFGTGIRNLSVLHSPHWVDTMSVCVMGLNAVLTIISIGFTVGLIYGVHKNISKYIHPFMIYNAIFLIYHVVEFFFNLVSTMTTNDPIVDLVSILLTAYFLVVVRSYWLELKTQEAALKTQVPIHPSPPPYTSAPTVYLESMEKPPRY